MFGFSKRRNALKTLFQKVRILRGFLLSLNLNAYTAHFSFVSFWKACTISQALAGNGRLCPLLPQAHLCSVPSTGRSTAWERPVGDSVASDPVTRPLQTSTYLRFSISSSPFCLFKAKVLTEWYRRS